MVDLGITCGDPQGEPCKARTNPIGFLFISLQPLLKASFHRVFSKINNPADAGFVLALRREGDSNPRYPFEVHTLSRRAN